MGDKFAWMIFISSRLSADQCDLGLIVTRVTAITVSFKSVGEYLHQEYGSSKNCCCVLFDGSCGS